MICKNKFLKEDMMHIEHKLYVNDFESSYQLCNQLLLAELIKNKEDKDYYIMKAVQMFANQIELKSDVVHLFNYVKTLLLFSNFVLEKNIVPPHPHQTTKAPRTPPHLGEHLLW